MPNVKIKNYVGADCIYEDVDKVWLASEDSTDDNPDLLPYTYGEALEGVEVTPDFSGGDMQITVPEGYLARSAVVKKPENLIPGNIKAGETVAGIPGEYEGETVELEEVTVALAMANGDQVIEPTEGKALGKVTLTKPETLVPENIAEGVNIAGIVGALVAGGGGGNAVIKTGSFTGNKEIATVEHGLGMVPDLFHIYRGSDLSGDVSNYLGFAFGVSSNMTMLSFSQKYQRYAPFDYSAMKSYGACIDQTNGPIQNANETSIQIGNASYVPAPYITYTWFAIGGLT